MQICKFALDPPNATCNSVVTQEAGAPERNGLVAIAIDIDGLMNSPRSSDLPNTVENSLIQQFVETDISRQNELVLVNTSISWITE